MVERTNMPGTGSAGKAEEREDLTEAETSSFVAKKVERSDRAM